MLLDFVLFDSVLLDSVSVHSVLFDSVLLDSMSVHSVSLDSVLLNYSVSESVSRDPYRSRPAHSLYIKTQHFVSHNTHFLNANDVHAFCARLISMVTAGSLARFSSSTIQSAVASPWLLVPIGLTFSF